MFSKIFSQEAQFKNFLNLYSEKIKKVSVEFYSFLQEFDSEGVLAWARKIKEMENDCDKVTHDTLNWLRKTFVVNYDRDDIHRLAANLDDIVDLMNAAATRVSLYGLSEMNKGIVDMAEQLLGACKGVARAIVVLPEHKGEKEVLGICKEVKDFEEQGDRIYHQTLAELFKGGNDPLDVMKWKEILDEVEGALDTCNTVTNIIEGIVLKYY